MSHFDSDPPTCGRALFLAKNSPNSAKSNRIFPGKERGDRALILTYFDNPMADVFSHDYLFFSILVIFKGNRGSNLNQKCKFWIRRFSTKLESFKKFSNKVFVYLSATFGENFGKIGSCFGGVRTQQPPKKGYFMDAESVRKTLKTYNLTTTYAILMKLGVKGRDLKAI